mmetsp:Transcript_17481/g.35082  ORF Transcript_17481/g.35082 Transcript_17481/m.35082 type:complete len:389 (-) Transcript_17481:40-1206(-)
MASTTQPPPPPSECPPAPFFIDYDYDDESSSSSITFGFAAVSPSLSSSPLFHIQMRLLDEDSDPAVWSTISQTFAARRVRKKNLQSDSNSSYVFRYRVRDSIDYLTPWSTPSLPMSTLCPSSPKSPTPRLKKAEKASVTLTWDHAPDEVTTSDDFLGYEIFMRLEDSPFSSIGRVRSNEVKKKNLDYTQKYYFRIGVSLSPGSGLGPYQISPSSSALSPSAPVTAFVQRSFPPSLLTRSGRSSAPSPLGRVLPPSKFILLYFSAHWCGPCRQFTPRLAQFYRSYAREYEFEVVFVSADHDSKAFESYYNGEMPWSAVPYDDDSREDLQGRYRVSGIPSLRVLRSDGTVIDENGTSSTLDEKAARGWRDRADQKAGEGGCGSGCCNHHH